MKFCDDYQYKHTAYLNVYFHLNDTKDVSCTWLLKEHLSMSKNVPSLTQERSTQFWCFYSQRDTVLCQECWQTYTATMPYLKHEFKLKEYEIAVKRRVMLPSGARDMLVYVNAVQKLIIRPPLNSAFL